MRTLAPSLSWDRLGSSGLNAADASLYAGNAAGTLEDGSGTFVMDTASGVSVLRTFWGEPAKEAPTEAG